MATNCFRPASSLPNWGPLCADFPLAPRHSRKREYNHLLSYWRSERILLATSFYDRTMANKSGTLPLPDSHSQMIPPRANAIT